MAICTSAGANEQLSYACSVPTIKCKTAVSWCGLHAASGPGKIVIVEGPINSQRLPGHIREAVPMEGRRLTWIENRVSTKTYAPMQPFYHC